MAPKFVSLILLLLLLLIISASFELLGCDASPVNGMSQSTLQSTQEILQTNPRGIRAALIHRDHVSSPFSARATGRHWSPTEKLQDDARRSVKRVRFLSRRRVRRQLAENAPSSSPGGQPVNWESALNDASDAEYLMEITLGTPPQTFVAVADTGSDLTWLQCLPCKSCFNQSQSPFDPSLSSTYATLSCSSSACEFLNQTSTCPYVSLASGSASNSTDCSYTYYYADNSQTAGTLAEETITMDILEGNDVQQVPSFWFGCSHKSYSPSDLFDQANGLVGLGQGLVSFPSQLGKYFGNKFSYCLVNRSASLVLESPLIFGDAAVPETTANGFQLQFTPLITNPVLDPGSSFGFYYVDMDNVSVNGVAVTIPPDAFDFDVNGNGGTFFDSGTTFTSLVTAAFDPLVAAMSTAITTYSVANNLDPYFELCYNAKWEKWASEYGQQVPKLSFKFANATTFELGVEGSWIEYDTEHVCLAIARSSNVNVFGNVQQVNYQILYDLELQQIGFLPANCTASPVN